MNTTNQPKKGWQTCACGCGRSFRVLANQTTGRRKQFFSASCRVKAGRQAARAAASMPPPATIPSGPLVLAANDQRSARGEHFEPAPGGRRQAVQPVQVNTHTTGSTKNFGRIARSAAQTVIYIREDRIEQTGASQEAGK